jgi:hypothetical protein
LSSWPALTAEASRAAEQSGGEFAVDADQGSKLFGAPVEGHRQRMIDDEDAEVRDVLP